MDKLDKINAEHIVDHEDFADFVTFKLYCYFLPKSIPKGLSKRFEKIENEKMEDITEFFTHYINSIKDLNLLHSIWDELKAKIWKWVWMWNNWNIAKEIKKLLKILDEKILILEKQIDTENLKEGVKTKTQEVLDWEKEVKKPRRISKYIKLENWTFDFDVWEDIFNRYLICFWKIISYPWIRNHKLKEFIERLKPENRWLNNVFPQINLFFEHFGFIEFYEYILGVLASDDPKRVILAEAVKKYLPVFKISWWNNEYFLWLQENIIKKAKKELEKQKTKRNAE